LSYLGEFHLAARVESETVGNLATMPEWQLAKMNRQSVGDPGNSAYGYCCL
jgi:hypothetical protein